MIAIAGGILIAVVAVLVLIGFASVARQHGKLVLAVALVAVAALYVGYVVKAQTEVVNPSGDVPCTGQCRYR